MTALSIHTPVRRAAAALLAASVAACTVFNDLELPEDAGADAGFTPFDPSYLSVDDAARVCRWVAECDQLAASVTVSIGVPLDPDNFSQCMHWLAGPLPRNRPGTQIQADMLASIAAATSCDDALGRVFVEVLGPADPRCAGAGAACLDATTALHCPGRRSSRCDSPRFADGSTCKAGVDQGDAVGTCSTGPCVGQSSSCLGGVWSVCLAGESFAVDCSTIGMVCHGADLGACSPSSTKAATKCLVDQVGAAQCEQSERAEICNGAAFVEYSCGAADATCVEEQGTVRCVPYATACSPFDADENVCDGDRVAVCVGGQKTSVDCAALGLGCLPPGGSRGARCGSK